MIFFQQLILGTVCSDTLDHEILISVSAMMVLSPPLPPPPIFSKHISFHFLADNSQVYFALKYSGIYSAQPLLDCFSDIGRQMEAMLLDPVSTAEPLASTFSFFSFLLYCSPTTCPKVILSVWTAGSVCLDLMLLLIPKKTQTQMCKSLVGPQSFFPKVLSIKIMFFGKTEMSLHVLLARQWFLSWSSAI